MMELALYLGIGTLFILAALLFDAVAGAFRRKGAKNGRAN